MGDEPPHDVEAPYGDDGDGDGDDDSVEERGEAVAPVIVVSPARTPPPSAAAASPGPAKHARLAPLAPASEEKRSRAGDAREGVEEEKRPEGSGRGDGAAGRGGAHRGNAGGMQDLMRKAKEKKENHLQDDDEQQHACSVPLMVAMAKAKRQKDDEKKEQQKKDQLANMLNGDNDEKQALLSAMMGVALANKTLERTARVLLRGVESTVCFTAKGSLASPAERSRLLRRRLTLAYQSRKHGALKRRGWRGWYSRRRFQHRVATARGVQEQGAFAGRGAARIRQRATLVLCEKFACMDFFNFIVVPVLLLTTSLFLTFVLDNGGGFLLSALWAGSRRVKGEFNLLGALQECGGNGSLRLRYPLILRALDSDVVYAFLSALAEISMNAGTGNPRVGAFGQDPNHDRGVHYKPVSQYIAVCFGLMAFLHRVLAFALIQEPLGRIMDLVVESDIGVQLSIEGLFDFFAEHESSEVSQRPRAGNDAGPGSLDRTATVGEGAPRAAAAGALGRCCGALRGKGSPKPLKRVHSTFEALTESNESLLVSVVARALNNAQAAAELLGGTQNVN